VKTYAEPIIEDDSLPRKGRDKFASSSRWRSDRLRERRTGPGKSKVTDNAAGEQGFEKRADCRGWQAPLALALASLGLSGKPLKGVDGFYDREIPDTVKCGLLAWWQQAIVTHQKG